MHSFTEDFCPLMMQKESYNSVGQVCFHCGTPCDEEEIEVECKSFCCTGCLTVHNILQSNGMGNYYSLEKHPGTKKNGTLNINFTKNPEIVESLLDYKDDEKSVITFRVPAIHCSSCIWLLENLSKLTKGVSQSRVNFEKREVRITFHHNEVSLNEILQLLSNIGYDPEFELDKKSKSKSKNALIKKLAFAGFCFGNIMLFSFPEYFGLNMSNDFAFGRTFQFLNLFISIPLVFFSGSVYLTSAYKSIKSGTLHIHIPISIGIVALFLWSVYEVLSLSGSGYFDSLAGLIFFLLIGKWFQDFTYERLVFDRKYDTYFPLSAQVLKDGKESTLPLSDLKTGDRILIRKGELIPADGHVFHGTAQIDYSFVTGESVPVHKELGEIVYAGGRQLSEAIEIEINKEVSQSKLVSLWNDSSFEEKEDELSTKSITAKIGKYFTIALLFIASATFIFWQITDPSKALFSTISVLIIACPCALALAYPFATGSAIRILAKNGIYLKNAGVIERLTKIKKLVFDKTGTLTKTLNFHSSFHGKPLSTEEKRLISSLVKLSDHPFSSAVSSIYKTLEDYPVNSFKEIPGKGVEGWVNDHWVKMGSASFIFDELKEEAEGEHQVYVSIDNAYIGAYDIQNEYHSFLGSLWSKLKDRGHSLFITTGDTEREESYLKNEYGGLLDEMIFRASPEDKLRYVKLLNETDDVAYFGDGLNDAGALKSASVGVAVSESLINFSPASDAIITLPKLEGISEYLEYSKKTLKTVHIGIVISALYNVVGLYFAVQGLLSPVLAAILMPISSITTVSLMAILTHYYARKVLNR
jgi:Cu+-exporting ATPase